MKFDTYVDALDYSLNKTNGVAILGNHVDYAIAEDEEDLQRLLQEGYVYTEEEQQ